MCSVGGRLGTGAQRAGGSRSLMALRMAHLGVGCTAVSFSPLLFSSVQSPSHSLSNRGTEAVLLQHALNVVFRCRKVR